MDCQQYTPCVCVGAPRPCTVQERPDPCKNYSEPLSIDTSLEYSNSTLGVTGTEGSGLLSILVTPAPPVADTQTISTTTIIQGSQRTIPSEEHYDPYLASRFTQLTAVPHDLHPHQQHEYLLTQEEEHELRQATFTRDDPMHDCDTSDAWCFSHVRNPVHVFSEKVSSDHTDQKQFNMQNGFLNSNDGRVTGYHHLQSGSVEGYPVHTTDSWDRYTSDGSERYWECSNDSSNSSDSYWNQETTQYNFPDYDILNRSQGNMAAGSKPVSRTVYDDYRDSGCSSLSSSAIGYTTSCHMVMVDQYTYTDVPEANRPMGLVGRHCGQMAGRLITPDFFKSNIYAEEWIMNH